MIDDKKIGDAALGYCAKYSDITNRNVDLDEDEYADLYNGFIDGAKWTINEFLKDLLHPNTEEPDKNKGDIITLVLITMLIHNLKNSFFGIRNLGDIRLADSKSSSGLIYLIYYQKILLIINLIKRNSVW